jgi:hypothetical protein
MDRGNCTRHAKCGDGMNDLSNVTVSSKHLPILGFTFASLIATRGNGVAECSSIVRRDQSITEQIERTEWCGISGSQSIAGRSLAVAESSLRVETDR